MSIDINQIVADIPAVQYRRGFRLGAACRKCPDGETGAFKRGHAEGLKAFEEAQTYLTPSEIHGFVQWMLCTELGDARGRRAARIELARLRIPRDLR